ncbi:chemotaxis protein CheW [Arsukibacterium sp.]|uniref:chemotaxis protein CheW n=1 Tax=Arsukibacterium sp. TaxID=1977258 RepID=UPI002FDB1DC8
MSNLIASQKVMQQYLSALLTDDHASESTLLEDAQKAQLNRLLAKASPQVAAPVVTKPAPVLTPTQPVAKVNPVIPQVSVAPEQALSQLKTKAAQLANEQRVHERNIPIAQRLDVQPTPSPAVLANKEYRQGRFQALFFDVAGLKVAVPLKELGGIHELGEVNSLFGKPDWFKGVMLHRQQKINVVDTARWVMPEKYDEQLQRSLNYQYVIMLGSSNWGLCCEQLIDTITLEQDDVKWRTAEAKRPWMAGLIKKHMCVLVDVDAMLELLSRGQNIHA